MDSQITNVKGAFGGNEGAAAVAEGTSADGDLHHVLQDEGNTEGADEGGNAGGIAQRPIGKPLYRHADDACPDHRHNQHNENDECGGNDGSFVGVKQNKHAVAQIGTNHVNVAVGKVEQLENAIDHGIAEGDEGVDAAQGQAVDQGLGEEVEEVGHWQERDWRLEIRDWSLC